MMKEDSTKGPLGTVRISDDAIASISAIAAKQVNGVVDLNGNIGDFLLEFIGKSNHTKGIKVDLLGKEVIVEVSICVKYGVEISDVTTAIQEKVREAIEHMTGLTVNAINVNINTVKLSQ